MLNQKIAMDISYGLKKLGLNSTEEKVYLFILRSGTTDIYEIYHQTKIKRTTAYSILENLIQKRLITLIDKDGHREYFAENPRNIVNLLAEKEHNLLLKQQQMIQNYPELASLYNAHATKPKIKVYEGIEAIKESFNEMLNLPKKSEILSYTNSEELISNDMQEFMTTWFDQLAKKEISNRIIAEDSAFTRELQQKDKTQLRNMVLVEPKEYPCFDRISIFGDKVCITSFKDKLTLIMESKPIAESQRTIFELAWIGAQKVGKLSPNPYIPPKK